MTDTLYTMIDSSYLLLFAMAGFIAEVIFMLFFAGKA